MSAAKKRKKDTDEHGQELWSRPKLLARIPRIKSVESVAEGPCGSVSCFFELQQIVSRVSGTGARSISR
jgi:hypothetical protein